MPSVDLVVTKDAMAMIGSDIILVLDAMGVVYSVGDDVADLLVPFVREHSGVADPDENSRNYTLASLGEIEADTFWHMVGISPDLELEYLARHQLADGVLEFSRDLPSSVSAAWCLSNAVSRWSQVLRTKHGLNQFIADFVISGDVGVRKPAPRIYQVLLDRTRLPAHSHVFVDDRTKNLAAAESLGFRTVQFNAAGNAPEPGDGRLRASSFAVLWDQLNCMS